MKGPPRKRYIFLTQHDIPNIHKDAFEQLLEACKICGNNFPEITKIKGSDAKEYIGNDLNGFLSKLNNTELNDLFKAAHFLKIKGLEMCIAAFLACRVYIPLSLEAYEAKKKELGVDKNLTTEVSSQYRNKYMFLWTQSSLSSNLYVQS